MPQPPGARRCSMPPASSTTTTRISARRPARRPPATGLAPGLQPLGRGVTLHIACHARAQNMGQKAAEMLRLLPDAQVNVIERCSGHGGTWGVLKDNFEAALKVGRPVARQALRDPKPF